MASVSDRSTTPPTRSGVVLLYPGCTIAEVIELNTRLTDNGFELTHVAAGIEAVAGGPTLITDQSGLHLAADTTLTDEWATLLDPAAIEVVVVPGGDPGVIMDDARVSAWLAGASEAGSLVAGICAGVLVMAAAGLLRGRAVTHNYRKPWVPAEVEDFTGWLWDGATVEPDPTVGVVVDGRVITALPNATVAFAMTVCRELGLYTAEHASLLGRHLGGEYVAELYAQT